MIYMLMAEFYLEMVSFSIKIHIACMCSFSLFDTKCLFSIAVMLHCHGMTNDYFFIYILLSWSLLTKSIECCYLVDL